MIELTYKHLIAHQEVIRNRIIGLKKDQDNLQGEVPMYEIMLNEGKVYSKNLCIVNA